MPETGSAEPARIIAWHVRPGGTVAEGDPICTVDLGTAHGVVSSPASGRLRNAFVGVRATVDAGATLALIEVAPAVPAILSEPAPEPDPDPDPEPQPEPEPTPQLVAPEPADAGREAEDVGGVIPLQRFHSPAVRRLASDLGVDLAEIRGTGRDGRVSRQDVVAAAGAAQVST
jgi:2-oxoglutarate dehydrogenase E2 component (dihydrolipoamide succinyltransferase)